MKDNKSNRFVNIVIITMTILGVADMVMEFIYPEEYSFQYIIFMAVFFAVPMRLILNYQQKQEMKFKEDLKRLDEELKRQLEHLAKEFTKEIYFKPTPEEEVFGITDPSIVDKKYLKSKYRELSLIFHPDKGGDEEHMKAINICYEKLKEKYINN